MSSRIALCFALLLACLTTPTLAREGHTYGQWHHHSSHRRSGCSDNCYVPTQPGPVPSHSAQVPEIDAGAAVGGLALLIGFVMLLRDRMLTNVKHRMAANVASAD